MAYYKIAISAKRAMEELYLVEVEADSAEEAEARAKIIVHDFPGPTIGDTQSRCKRVKQEVEYTDIKDVEVQHAS